MSRGQGKTIFLKNKRQFLSIKKSRMIAVIIAVSMKVSGLPEQLGCLGSVLLFDVVPKSLGRLETYRIRR